MEEIERHTPVAECLSTLHTRATPREAKIPRYFVTYYVHQQKGIEAIITKLS